MSERLTHPPDEELLGLADAELGGSEAARVREHLGSCAACSARLAGIEAALRDHDCLHLREKESFPAPPRPWDDIRARLVEAETQRPRVLLGMPPRAWLAVAATLLISFALVERFWQPEPVSAAELLRKASAAATANPPRAERRIQVKARGRAVVRPAALRQGGDSELHALFASAGYSWEDPLSVASFAGWRDGLREKHDEVTVEPALYLIRTTTPHGALAAATISLSTADLRPVRETLEFRNRELVEISELPDGGIPPAAAEPPALPAAPAIGPPASAVPGPAGELRVLAALHAIGADLGEPIQLSRRGPSLVVSGTGLDPRRQEEVRTSVAGIPGVEVQFATPPAGRPLAGLEAEPPVPAPTRRPGWLETELPARLGEGVPLDEFTGHALDASDAVMARAHALRALAVRFPSAAEAALNAADRAVLAGLRRDHASALQAAVRHLEQALTPLVAPGGPVRPAGAPDWQAGAQSVLTAAREVDRLLNVMLAGSGGDRTAELRAAMAVLQAEVAAGEGR